MNENLVEIAENFVNELSPKDRVIGEQLMMMGHNAGVTKDKLVEFEKIAWEKIDAKFPNLVEIGNFGLGRTVIVL